MSSGREHEAIGKRVMLAGLVLGAVGVAYGVDERLVLLGLGGMWAGFYLVTPDADFAVLSRSESRWFRDPRKNDVGSLLKAMILYQVGIAALVLGFWPGLLLSHRKISHVPILGSVVIAVLALANPLIVGLLWATGWWKAWDVGAIGVAWGGFCFSHFIHIVADRFG